MGEEIKRIRINSLSSENNIFDKIVFHDGVNLILGEKYDDSRIQGRKTNGVGKSMCVEFLDFCLLSDYEKSRIAKIPENVFPPEENIALDLTIGEENIVIKRNRRDRERPIFFREGKRVQFNKIQDAREYLKELTFGELTAKEVPSVRNLFSILIRDERSGFADIFKCHDLSKRVPDDMTVHLFLLGLSLENYKRVLTTIKEIEKTALI